MPKVIKRKRHYEVRVSKEVLRIELPPVTSHKVYTEEDFNDDEKAANNPLFLAVYRHKRAICKKCGATGTELFEKYCK